MNWTTIVDVDDETTGHLNITYGNGQVQISGTDWDSTRFNWTQIDQVIEALQKVRDT